MPPTDPDDNPTQPLDDIWAPRPGATADTVDSATPPTTRGRRGLRAIGVAGAVLALVAAGAFGALLAGGGDGGTAALTGVGSSTDESTTDEDGTDSDDGTAGDRARGLGKGLLGHRMGGMGGHGMAPGMLGRGLHGSFVVEKADGGYQTVLTQQGTATAVSDTSITVKSSDGFVATYRLTDDSAVLSGPEGTEAIAEGADVAVTALKTGSSARAVHVVDLSQVRDRFEHHFGDRFGGPDAPDDDDLPAPSSTATSGASV